MRTLLAALMFSVALGAQDLTFYVDNSGSLSPLGSTYTMPPTTAGTASSITARVVNTSANPIQITQMIVATAAGALTQNSNFAITGLDIDGTLAAQTGFAEFTVSFTPAAGGQFTGFLVVAYAEQQNGCGLPGTNQTPACPVTTVTVSQLQGTAGPPQLVLTYNGITPQPNTAAPIYFNNVAIGSTNAITFTLTNQSSGTVTVPSIAIQGPQYFASQFSLDTSNVPSSLSAGASATFTVTFTPQANAAGPANPETATLVVGPNSYQLQGAAVPAPGTGNDGFQITWTDETGVKQTGTTVAMGPDPTTTTLTFTVANPDPDATEMLQSAPTISSSAFTLQNFVVGPGQGVSGSAAAVTSWPLTIPSGWALTFQVTFTASGSSGATGVLTIAPGYVYNLVGKAPAPLSLTLMCGATPCSSQGFTSQEQVQATLQWANTSSTNVPSPVDLSLSFSSGVSGITKDPAIEFIAPPPSGMIINQISFTQNSPTGTISGSGSQFTFQTGTTEGTITLTATGLEGQTQTWSFDILPAKVQITSITAQTQTSNLVVTMDGYDNTYTAGQLSFTFYNTSGGVIGSAITVDASSNFHQYFFGADSAGGAFALQASFPVNGDVTQVGSVSVSITNSSGTTSTTASFQ